MVLDFLQQVFFALLCLAILYTSAFTKNAPGEWTALINYRRMPEGLKGQSGGGGMIGCSVYTPAVISKHFTLLFCSISPLFPTVHGMIRCLIPRKRQVSWNRITSCFLWAWKQKGGCFPFSCFPPSAYFKSIKTRTIERGINWGFCEMKQCRPKQVSVDQMVPDLRRRDLTALLVNLKYRPAFRLPAFARC